MTTHFHMSINNRIAPEPFGARTRMEIMGEIGRRKRYGLPKAELVKCNGDRCPSETTAPDATTAEYQIEYRNRPVIAEQR